MNSMVTEPKCKCGRKVGLLFGDNHWWCYDCVWAEIKRLRAIIAKFSKTADGVPLVPEMTVFVKAGSAGHSGGVVVVFKDVEELHVGSVGRNRLHAVSPNGLAILVSPDVCYSTREATRGK